jgi:hypothetical protein
VAADVKDRLGRPFAQKEDQEHGKNAASALVTVIVSNMSRSIPSFRALCIRFPPALSRDKSRDETTNGPAGKSAR